MSHRTAQVLRAATILVFVAIAVVGYRTLNPKEEFDEAERRSGEIDVVQALNVPPEPAVAVRGFVFDGPEGFGLRLCQARENKDSPRCVGPFVDLEGVDRGSFEFRSGRSEQGRPMWWSPKPVTLVGTVSGTRMNVQQVLS